MRAFIVMCLVAAACADQLGYNYQPVGHSNSGLSFTPGSGSIGGSFPASGGNLGGHGIGNFGAVNPSGIVSGGIGGIGGAPSYGGNAPSYGGNAPSNVGNSPSFGGNAPSYNVPSYNAPAELEKEFYTFSAPEGEFDDGNAAQKIAGSVKQGLRVIFIKGPENNGLERAALALAKHAAEQKTAIYVLNKQADVGDLAQKLNAINKNINNKPEVHFVKYRTPEDAANAQKAIEGQYDSLGGKSQSHNGGVAPVLNFASQAPVQAAPAHAPGNAYLPSSIFRN